MSAAQTAREASKDEKAMAIEAKTSFLNQLSQSIGEFIPANMMQNILDKASDILGHFEMVEIHAAQSGPDDFLIGYLAAMKVQGRSEKTINRYKYVITRMMDAVNVPCREITVHHLRSYFAQEQNRGIADSTIEGTRQVLSAYFGWLKNEELIGKNPTINLRKIKVPKKKKEVFSESDVAKLCRKCTNTRDLSIISFLKTTGCRISEMTGLDRYDLNLSGKECVVYGKGGKERTVYFGDVTAMYLKEYLSKRTDNSEALFANRYGERIGPNGVRRMLNRLADAAGVTHVHPHKFRRTLATNFAKHGMPVQEIAAILGHDKIDTTMKYVMLDENDTRNSYRKYA